MEKIDRQKVYEKFNGHCAYCGKEINLKEMQVDHIDPKIGGGTDNIENLYPSCRDCNNYKYHSSIELWRNYIENIYNELQKSAKWRVAEKFGIFERKNDKVEFYFEKFNNDKN